MKKIILNIAKNIHNFTTNNVEYIAHLTVIYTITDILREYNIHQHYALGIGLFIVALKETIDVILGGKFNIIDTLAGVLGIFTCLIINN